jgi:hypothetical protein
MASLLLGGLLTVLSAVPWLARSTEGGWSLMIFCARATRGRERPSLGLMVRPGRSIAKQSEGRAGEKYLPAGGRVRKLRAVEDQSGPIPERSRASLEGKDG